MNYQEFSRRISF